MPFPVKNGRFSSADAVHSFGSPLYGCIVRVSVREREGVVADGLLHTNVWAHQVRDAHLVLITGPSLAQGRRCQLRHTRARRQHPTASPTVDDQAYVLHKGVHQPGWSGPDSPLPQGITTRLADNKCRRHPMRGRRCGHTLLLTSWLWVGSGGKCASLT